MDIEKLIHCLQCCARVDAHNGGCDDCGLEYCGPECQQLCGTAATALSTLQAENEKLRNEVERQRRSADDRKHLYENAERAYMKVVAELERVTAERDAAIKEIFHWTGCPACKHWDSADNWCNKHDRSADSCDGCYTPEWRGLHKEE